MSLILQNDRIYVTDSSGNIKFDTSETKYPYSVTRLTGSLTISNTVASYQFTDTTGGESPYNVFITRYQGAPIDSNNILYTGSVPLSFAIASVRFTSENIGALQGDSVSYKLPINRWYAVTGSLLTELNVSKGGQVQRAAALTVKVNNLNQVILKYSRTGFNNDNQTAVSINLEYQIYVCRFLQ